MNNSQFITSKHTPNVPLIPTNYVNDQNKFIFLAFSSQLPSPFGDPITPPSMLRCIRGVSKPRHIPASILSTGHRMLIEISWNHLCWCPRMVCPWNILVLHVVVVPSCGQLCYLKWVVSCIFPHHRHIDPMWLIIKKKCNECKIYLISILCLQWTQNFP